MLHLEQQQTQTQRVDPRIILTNSVLQFTAQELLQSVEVELQENPALTVEEDEGCSGNCMDPASCPFCSQHIGQSAHEISSEAIHDQDIDVDLVYDLSPSDYEGEDYDPLSNIGAERTLVEHLLDQLRVRPPIGRRQERSEHRWVNMAPGSTT